MSFHRNGSAHAWAQSLGLIEGPFFSHRTSADESVHFVLLNGGQGSFALSVSSVEDLDIDQVASWVWSADLPHHIQVSPDHVTLSRWDDPTSTRKFSRISVENRLETLYSYLLLDRVKSRFDIVEHCVDLLKRIRSHVYERGLPDQASMHIFLYIIAMALSGTEDSYRNPDVLLEDFALDANYVDAFRALGQHEALALLAQFRSSEASLRLLKLVPELLVRHAAGTVFQEAHFEFLRSNPVDLFGLAGAAQVRIDTRGGTHFTPPGLARAVIEQAFKEVDLGRPSLTILDPACGAGAFLQEVVRFLHRTNYRGEINLIGYDASPIAISMARFAVNEAKKDWADGRIQGMAIDVRDSLAAEHSWPLADIVLMNPPFISWGNLNREQRERVRSVLGKWHTGQPDYCMAFIERALTSVGDQGVVGTLLPASILSIGSSLKWRRHLLDVATPTFLGILGDHGIFRYAVVEVGVAVFSRTARAEGDSHAVTSLWSSEKREASGEALRNLRKWSKGLSSSLSSRTSSSRVAHLWRITGVTVGKLKRAADWRPRPNLLENILSKIEDTFDTTVKDVFHVREGIRAGLRKAFILSPKDIESLGSNKRRYFRPVVEGRNIKNGHIEPGGFIFYPTTSDLEPIADEETLRRTLPIYYEAFLEPHKSVLKTRAGLGQRNWWMLNRPRSYFTELQPKLVSAFFGKAGSFAFDVDGAYVVVQGFVWVPASGLTREISKLEKSLRDQYVHQILHGYVALLNSKPFSLLLAEFCPHVAGGQYNLSKRFIDHVPLPNLAQLGLESQDGGSEVESLAEFGRMMQAGNEVTQDRLTELAAQVFRVPVELWPVSNA